MGVFSRTTKAQLGFLASSLVLVLLGQNCAGGNSLFAAGVSDSKTVSPSSGGGGGGAGGGGGSDGGFDGKIVRTFITSGTCSDGTSGTKARIGFTADSTHAYLMESDCKALSPYQSISPQAITWPNILKGYLGYAGALFASETSQTNGAPPASVSSTVIYCKGSNFDLSIFSSPTGFTGQVLVSNGDSTGILPVTYRSYPTSPVPYDEYGGGSPKVTLSQNLVTGASLLLDIEHLAQGDQYLVAYETASGVKNGTMTVPCWTQKQ